MTQERALQTTTTTTTSYDPATYEPWDLGTQVYARFPDDNDAWYWGIITDFDTTTGIYSITWSDGTYDEFSPADFDQVNQMVANADEPWAEGTTVYKQVGSASGNIWLDGIVSGYDETDGVEKPYQVTWSDGTMELYNEAGIDDMVDQVPGSNTLNSAQFQQAYEIGTQVYKQFDDGWYYWGTISAYSNDVYTIQWSDGGTELYSSELVTPMVQQAIMVASEKGKPHAETGHYAIGTPVQQFFQDGWYNGDITDFDGTLYTVTWDDGQINTYTEDEVAQFAADALVANPPTAVEAESPTPVATTTTPVTTTTTTTTPPVVAPATAPAPAPTTPQTLVPKYAIGNKVYQEFDQAGWFIGTITGFDSSGLYSVKWQDGAIESYSEQEISIMSSKVYEYQTAMANGEVVSNENENNPPPLANGPEFAFATVVYGNFEDGWYEGSVTAYDEYTGLYEVQWSDGDYETFDNAQIAKLSSPEFAAQFIQDQQQKRETKNGGGSAPGLKTGGMVVLILLGLVIFVYGSCHVTRRCRSRKEKSVTIPNYASNGGRYRDDEDDPFMNRLPPNSLDAMGLSGSAGFQKTVGSSSSSRNARGFPEIL
jgi:hypothetical protein